MLKCKSFYNKINKRNTLNTTYDIKCVNVCDYS